MFKSPNLLFDRRLWSLLVISALCLGLGRFALPAVQALDWVRVSGYWFMLALLLCAVVALVRLWWHAHKGWLQLWRNYWVWVVIVLTTLSWHAHEQFEFKILSDEAVLAGTAQNLHLQREVGYPVRTTNVRGPFEVLQSNIDKRPILFPFLVSLAHDWSGYRVQNVFWVNSVLGVVMLGLSAGLACRIGGTMAAAPAAVAWLAGIPLLAQQVSGGGFELLNLTLLVAWVWLAVIYANEPDDRRQDAFVLVAVMFGSTRYESLLYLAPTAFLMLWVWWRRGGVIFSFLTWLAPVLLLPTFWLNQAFDQNTGFWEMKSLGAEHPFGLEYVAGNLGHALAYLLSTDGYQPNSPVFGLLGLLALPVLLIWVLRRVRSMGELSGEDAGLLAGIAGLVGGLVLMMLYFWGQFDHPVIHRLSLPTQLLLWLAMLIVVREIAARWRSTWRVLGWSAAVVVVVWSLPVMARNAYSREYTPGLAFEWRQKFFEQLTTHNILFIDRDSLFWTLRKISSTPVYQAQARREGIAYHFRNHSFERIYVFQTFTVNAETGALSLMPEDDLGPGYVLEPVVQYRLAIGLLARISRVTAVNADNVTDATTVKTEINPAGIQNLPVPVSDNPSTKAGYLKEWVENLP